mgnify:CR=1 FL=1|nr:class B sortase [uncultured Eubacterium sp.]
MKKIIKISLILLLLGMAVIAAVPFFKEKRAERKYENEFKKIQESVTEKKSDVNGLVKKNKDCIGYVEIPGTTISYPVMQTKDNPDFYLNHDFNRNYSFYGTPYLSAYCDVNKSDNLIIYGHNINGGKMFGALERYKDKEFFNKHRKIYFITDKKREYEEFVDKVAEKSLWKTGDKPRYGGQILMLSTCDNGRGDDWRIVVIGRNIMSECV